MSKGKIVGALLLFLLPLIAWVGVAQAQSFRSGVNATVPQGERVDSSLWASGRNIDIAGEVNGDVFCAGMHVSVSGTVKGDVICAAQTINITGTVEGDVRLAAQTVTIGGDVRQNASLASQTFTLAGDGRVGQDLSAAANDVIINGAVGRDVAMAGATLSINSQIGRNVKAESPDVVLQENARVGGNLSYTSKQDAEIRDGAQVTGSTNRSEPEQKPESDTVLVSGVGVMLYVIASLMILSLALILLFPGAVREVTGYALAAPLRVFLYGLLAMFAVPAVLIILAVTILGIPLALLLLLVWLLILWLAGPTFSYYLGRLLLQSRSNNPFLAMVLGAFIVLVLFFIPILGWMLWLFAMIMGTGMLLTAFMRRAPRPDYRLDNEPAPKPSTRPKK